MQFNLNRSGISLSEALRLFVALVLEGGSYWAQEMQGEVFTDDWTEQQLLAAHLNARDRAWERHDGPFNPPNIPAMTFGESVTLKYVTCRGTEMQIRGSMRHEFSLNISGGEASVLRRALSIPEAREGNFWDSQSQMENGFRFPERLEELLAEPKRKHRREGESVVPSL